MESGASRRTSATVQDPSPLVGVVNERGSKTLNYGDLIHHRGKRFVDLIVPADLASVERVILHYVH